MRRKRAFFDMFLAAGAIIATLFTIYCANSPGTPDLEPSCPHINDVIISPNEGQSFTTGETVTFQINDNYGGFTFYNVQWSSDIDGPLGTTDYFTRDDLSAGTHTLTLNFWDEPVYGGDTVSCWYDRTIHVGDVINDCPDFDTSANCDDCEHAYCLQEPLDGGVFGESEPIDFGVLLSYDASVSYTSIQWASSIDGPLSSEQAFSSTLSAGAHTISVTVYYDSSTYGTGYCSQEVGITVESQLIMSYDLPGTGLTLCYGTGSTSIDCPAPGEPFYGQDAQYGPNVMSVIASSDGTAWDMDAGLIWQRGYSGSFSTIYNWYEASGTYDAVHNPGSTDVCGDLDLAGQSWRLPTLRELATFTDYGRLYPALDTSIFEAGTPIGSFNPYWSATETAWSDSRAWFVDATTGSAMNILKDMSDGMIYESFVRCVTYPSLPAPAFSVHDSLTVTDNFTGLMWERFDSPANTWEEALAQCELATTGTYPDWRLPNVRELTSLIDYGMHSPAIDTTVFGDLSTAPPYWTSTTSMLDYSSAWLVDFDDGSLPANTKTSSTYAFRCVRGPD